MKLNWLAWILGPLTGVVLASGLSAGATSRPRPRPPLDGPRAIENFIRQLEHPDFTVRRCVARALGRLGAKARRAVPALTKACRDVHPEVRSAALLALERIGEAASDTSLGTLLSREPGRDADAR